MADNRRAGLISIAVDGELIDVKSEATYNLGTTQRAAIPGQDRIHGYKETVGVPRIEFKGTDRRGLDVRRLTNITDATITYRSGTGKTVVFRNAWFAGEGTITSSESEIEMVFEALSAEEV